MFFQICYRLLCFLTNNIRLIFKLYMRRMTGKSELQRILDKSQPGARTTQKFENSLRRSRNKNLRCLVSRDTDIGSSVITVLHTKHLPNELCAELTLRMSQIIGYNHLINTVETIRHQQHSDKLSDYESYLYQIWNVLQPDVHLSGLKSKQWVDIGFQGNQPYTDLRGMGMLGLTQLWYFVVNYPAEARQVYCHSLHPGCGYPFAIVGISLTSMLTQLLKRGQLRLHFYNVCRAAPGITHFHEAYCFMFYQFDDHWLCDHPNDIMEFNRVSEDYLKKLSTKLKDYNHMMKMDFQKTIP